jgi:hypothetical protein
MSRHSDFDYNVNQNIKFLLFFTKYFSEQNIVFSPIFLLCYWSNITDKCVFVLLSGKDINTELFAKLIFQIKNFLN